MTNEKEYYLYWDLFELYDIFKPMTDDLFEERFDKVRENNTAFRRGN